MFHLVSYWWLRRTQYIPECWTPVNPGLFESPKAFMLFPEIATVIDSIDSVTESLYLQLLALIPAGGIGETPIDLDITEIAKLLIFVSL